LKNSAEDSIIGRFDLRQYSVWKNVRVRFRISPEGLKRMEKGAAAVELFFNGNKEQVNFKSDVDAIASLRDTMRDFLGVELEVSKT